MGTKPRKYDDEFKRQAVYRLIHERISVTQLARELGTTTTALYEWKRRLGDQIAPPTTSNLSPDDELKRLRRENAQLREDNVILKKYAAYIVKESR
jgi:transposase